jgi:hypothetical protein
MAAPTKPSYTLSPHQPHTWSLHGKSGLLEVSSFSNHPPEITGRTSPQPRRLGLNFLIAGYVYSEGKTAFDPDLAIADANFHSNTEVLAYVRSFDIGGQSAKFDVIVPAPRSPRREL